MATYGYSTPYTGRGDMGPLPPGYLEAATAPGRNLAMGIAAMGQGLGKAIEQYRTKKAETEAATQSWETVSGLMQQQLASDPKYLAIQQYMETGALPQGVSEQDIPRYTQQVQADREMLNKFSALGEKFPDMSLAKKKAALGDAVMVLNQYRTDQQNQVRDAAARQQLALGAAQLGDIQEKRRQNEILTSAIKYGLEQPTSQTVTEQTQVPVSVQYQPEGPFSVAPQQAETSMRPEQIYSEQAPEFRPLQQPQFMRPQGLPGTQTPPSSIPKTWESVLGAKFANQLGTPVKSDLFKPTTVQNQGVTTFETTNEVPVTSEKVVPYEEQSKRLTQFLVQQGARPETLAMVPQILSMVGQQRPTRVEQVGNIGSVVRFGDKEQFVPAKEANIGDMLKVKGLTIDFPEFRGTAPTEAEASKFREQYSNVLDSRKAIAELLDIAKMGTAMQQTPEVRARANSLASGLRGIERINIIGPGTITPEDFKLLNSVIPDPTSIFSLKKSNIQAFETMLQKSARAIESRAKSIGLEVLKPDQQQTVSSLLNDPRVASIRARAASGAITRQQAAQELKSLQ